MSDSMIDGNTSWKCKSLGNFSFTLCLVEDISSAIQYKLVSGLAQIYDFHAILNLGKDEFDGFICDFSGSSVFIDDIFRTEIFHYRFLYFIYINFLGHFFPTMNCTPCAMIFFYMQN